MVNLERVLVTFSARVVVFFSFNHRTTLLIQLHSNTSSTELSSLCVSTASRWLLRGIPRCEDSGVVHEEKK